jgi:integrase
MVMPKKVNNALTNLSVKNATTGRHADGGGLYLLVKDTGARSWVFRYRLNGKSRDAGLGPAAGTGALSLSSARDRAAELRFQVRSKIDPLAERVREAAAALAEAEAAKVAAVTFKDAALAHIELHEGSWKNEKHRHQWRRTLETYVYPVIGHLPVAEVNTSHVLEVLNPIWKDKAPTADRIRLRIESILDGAKVHGYRQGENPARWRGNLAHILPAPSKLKRGHFKALAYAKMPEFMHELRRRNGVSALALEFTILTVARTDQTISATWKEINLETAIWLIPAIRMKAGREHRVPLSPRVVEILMSVRQFNSPYLFPNAKGGKLSSAAMHEFLRHREDDATVHGFRSTFTDWASECTGHANEAIQLAKAHAIPDKVERAYRRGDLLDKRRELAKDWESFCLSGLQQ